MMMTSPEVAGLLYKKRGGFGKMMPNAWQYRFVAITKEGYLLYFDTENADAEFDISKARGRLDLKSIQYDYSIDAIEGAPTNYSIQIGIPNEEKWKLCADSKEIQAKWCKVLDKFMTEKVVTKPVKTVAPQSDDDADRQRKSTVNAITYASNTGNAVPSTSSNDSGNISTNNDAPPVMPNNANQDQVTKTADILPQTIDETPVKTLEISSPPESVNKVVSSTVGTKSSHQHQPKKRLKLAAKKNFIDQESIEWVLVLLVLNVSFLGICTGSNLLLKLIYVIACNYVVGYTLNLRFHRTTKAAVVAPATGKQEHSSGAQHINSPVEAEATTKFDAEKSQSETLKIDHKCDVVVEEQPSAVSLPGQKPTAGCTYVQAFVDPKLAPPHTWSRADHRQFSVRVGPDYNRYKKKAPSGPPIYEPFAVDMFCAKQRVDHAATRFQLPDTSNINTNNPHVPPIFVVQIQIPSEPPTSFFSNSEDGPGWAVVMYFKITQDACNQLKDISTASPAVKLFAEWCEKAPNDPAWRGRFKVINSCTNMEELGFPSMIVSYNAKPVLIRRTGTIFKGPNYMEMDIHVHKFANVAKQSRDDKELPEALFGCVAVNRPQEDQAEFIFDD